ncbi:MAG: T9SS type A sorting domain-containing protein [Bacteroidetes bacterium]|nr:T9SS type A sorting domain-containing protein [Bacteroidota bacterium]HET6243688.1 T9SS type A sorting domain-containing protein [Bacteroidia bacterium]
MPKYVGTQDVGGKLDGLWGTVSQSSPAYIRIGGIDFDNLNPAVVTGYRKNLTDMIGQIRAKMPNVIIIVQIPVNNEVYTPAQAASLVTFLNQTEGLNIINFSIGNEPSSEYNTAGVDYTAAEIVNYFSLFSIAIRDAQELINTTPLTIWGPDLNENDYSYGPKWVLRDLLGGDPYSSINDICLMRDNKNRYILDVLAFHTYPYGPSYTRNDVISYPGGNFSTQLQPIITLVNAANQSRGANPLKIAVTEFNVNWASNIHTQVNPAIDGVGSSSFIAGQFWADMFSNGLKNSIMAMMPWSVHESGGDSDNGDKGYLGNPNGEIRKSTYWHFKLLADHFKSGTNYTANYAPGTVNGMPNLKAFGCYFTGNSTIANQKYIMLLNQDESATRAYTIHTNSSSGNINFSMPGTNKIITGDIPARTTFLIMIDCDGNESGRWIYKETDNLANQSPQWIEVSNDKHFTVSFDPPLYPSLNLSPCITVTASTTTSNTVYSYIATPPGMTPGTNNNEFTLCSTNTEIQHFIIATNNNGCKVVEGVTTDQGIAVGGCGPEITGSNATCSGNYLNGTASITNCYNCTAIEWNTGSTLYTLNNLSPGTYTAVVTNISALSGQPCTDTYTVTLNPDFIQQKKITGNAYWNNSGKVAGIVEIENGGKLYINSPLLEVASNTKFIVKSGGEMIVNASTIQAMSNCFSGNWQGIEVKPGGRLILNDGAQIKIKGNGKILIEATTASVGHLNYNQGAIINLTDAASTLELQGVLNIGANAVFTFSGNGFIKFNKPSAPFDNVQAASGSSINITKSSDTQKVIEVTQGHLVLPANLTLFRLNLCKVELGSYSYIMPIGTNTEIELRRTRIASNIGTANSNHNGFSLNGQSKVYIWGSIFENGNYGLRSLSVHGNSNITIISSTFRNCYIAGLYTTGSGVIMTDVTFKNNETGWFAQGMKSPSVLGSVTMGGSVANANYDGINYHGGSNATLTLNSSNISNNLIGGIYVSGANIKIRCSSIKNNAYEGIFMDNNSTLTMSSDHETGYNDLRGNGFDAAYGNGDKINIRFKNAKNFLVNNGYNNLSTGTNVHYKCASTDNVCDPSIDGTLRIDYNNCGNNNCSDIHIQANNNRWISDQITFPALPRYKKEYKLTTSYNCYHNQYSQGQTRKILLKDDYPQNNQSCPSSGGGGVIVIDNPLFFCPSCIVINTPSFNNKKINLAVREIIEKVVPDQTGSQNTNRIAVQNFHEIFKYLKDNEPAINNKDAYLIKLSYQYMLEALGNAYINNELQEVSLNSNMPDEVLKVLDTQNYILDYSDCFTPALYEDKKISLGLDKGQVLRLAGKRNLALNEFNNILSGATLSDKETIESWICLTEKELSLQNELIDIHEFTSEIESCPKTRKRNSTSSNRFVQELELKENEHKHKDFNFKLYPNPASNAVKVQLPGTDTYSELIIYNSLGIQVKTIQLNTEQELFIDCTHFATGIYQFVLKSGNSVLVERLVISK